MKRILLIRHAQSTNNAVVDRLEEPGARLTGEVLREAEARREADCDLTPLGLKQAELLAQSIAASRFDRPMLVSSPMLRALRTAGHIATALGLDRERFCCHAEFYEVGGSFYLDRSVPTSTPDEIASRFAVSCREFPPHGWGFDGRGREPAAHADSRVTRALRFLQDELKAPDALFDTLIVVAHGEFLLRLMRRWLGVPVGRGVAIIHSNTGITSLTWDDRRGMLMHAINDVSHLPVDLRTGDGPGWWEYVAPELSITRYDSLADVPDAARNRMQRLRDVHLWTIDGAPADRDKLFRRSVHFVAEVGDIVAGCVLFDPETRRLRQMVVEPRFRRHGVGIRLVHVVEEEARRHGLDRVAVHAWEESSGFYERAGFQSAGDLQPGPGAPWRPMSLQLTQ